MDEWRKLPRCCKVLSLKWISFNQKMRETVAHKSIIFFGALGKTFKETFQAWENYCSQALDLLKVDLMKLLTLPELYWINCFCPGVMNNLSIRDLSFHTERGKKSDFLFLSILSPIHLSFFFFMQGICIT